MAAAGATVGALAVSLLWFTFGSPRQVPVVVTERVAMTPLDSTPPRLVDAEDWATEVAAEAWPSIVRLDGSDATVSAVVLRDDGTVVTSASALADSAELMGRFSTGKHEEVQVLAVDDVTDTAVIKLLDEPAQPAVVSNRGVRVHDQVSVVASIDSDAYVASAEVTDVEVTATDSDDVLHDTFTIDLVDVPDGAIVLDASGSVVGVTTRFESEHGTYVMPIDVVKSAAEELLTNGWVRHEVWMGVEVETVPKALGLPGAARVVSVTENSPAERIGLEVGDLITKVDGRPIATAHALRELMTRMEPGDWTTVVYYSESTEHEARTQLGARPA